MAANHSNKHIRDALRYAESRGWIVSKANARAHCWGRIRCQFGHRECQMSIFSTPRNPENHARDIRRFVDRCRGAANNGHGGQT